MTKVAWSMKGKDLIKAQPTMTRRKFVYNLSRAGKPLLVRYDLAAISKTLTKDALAARAPDLWR